jgi:hypothetical protein
MVLASVNLINESCFGVSLNPSTPTDWSWVFFRMIILNKSSQVNTTKNTPTHTCPWKMRVKCLSSLPPPLSLLSSLAATCRIQPPPMHPHVPLDLLCCPRLPIPCSIVSYCHQKPSTKGIVRPPLLSCHCYYTSSLVFILQELMY